MKTNTHKKLPTSVPVLVIGIVLLLSLSLAAIYLTQTNISTLFSVSNMNARCAVYFDIGNGNTIPAQNSGNGIAVSLSKGEDNYIGNLRADVKYAGGGVGLIRVRVAEEWSQTKDGVRTVMPYKIRVPYVFDAYSAESGNQSKWFDNRDMDYCFYYATPVYVASEDSEKTVSLIAGFNEDDVDLGALPPGTELHVLVEADVVQVNRYPQYWGLSGLPWNGGVSASPDTELT